MDDIEVVGRFIAELLGVLGIPEIPETIIKQVASRAGGKTDSNYENKLKSSLGRIQVKTMATFHQPEVIEFNVDKEGKKRKSDGIGENFWLDGNAFQTAEVMQNLFTVVEDCLLKLKPLQSVVSGVKNFSALDSPAGFPFMRKVICAYIEKCDGKTFSTDDPPALYLKSICDEAQSQILDTDETVNTSNFKKYQKYLEREKALGSFQKLKEILKSRKDFATAKKVVAPFLELPAVAEKAISQIMQYGFTYEEAGGIYNQYFGCAYEPVDDSAVICVKCNKVNRFPEVRLNEKCVCGEPLFRKCRKKGCGMLVPRMVDVCPDCGMRESDYIRFEAMLPQVKAYAKRGCVEQAETALVYAQSLAPDRQEDLGEIQKQIEAAKVRRTETLNEFGKLINQCLFYTAAQKLAGEKKNYPPDVLQNVESRIVTAQNLADEMFSKADRTVEALQKVLAICADHPGALREIRKIPPKPPACLSASICEGYIQLSWEASSESGVQYRVIRKRNSAPATVFDSDGKFDIKTEKTYAKDLSPVTGKVYYAVFAERDGIPSSGGAAASLLFLPEVSDFSLCQLKDGVEISYRLPEGASGVRVERKNGTENTVIYEGLNAAVIDRTVLKRCAYTVTVIFDKRESNGKTLLFTAAVFPKEIKPQIHLEQNRICISWDTPQKGYEVRILEQTQGGFSPESGRLYSDRELAGKTRQLAEVSSEEPSVSFEAVSNRKYILLVLVGDPNGWLCCGVFPVFAEIYPQVAHIPESVDLQGNHYFLFEGNFSENVCGFSYLVSKQDKIAPDSSFRTGNMEGYNGINRPMIKIPTSGQCYVGRYYIFCRFKLKNGEETEAMRSEVHFRQDIQAVIDLKIKKGRLTGHVQFKLKRYDFEGYSELPELRLVAGSTVINLERCSVSPSKPNFSIPVNEQLPVLIDGNVNIKMEPVDKTFAHDFTIL